MMPLIYNNVVAKYPGHLRDESRKTGTADSISFPSSHSEVAEILSTMSKSKTPITMQAARTGITAGAVPLSGHIMSFDRMNKITALRPDGTGKNFILSVEPGVTLSQLRNFLGSTETDIPGWDADSLKHLKDMRKKGPFFFTPDPTEESAALGGMIACNASGACSFLYGSIRNYVHALDLIFADGSSAKLVRGPLHAKGRLFSFATSSGQTIAGKLPSYTMPSVKNAAGYYIEDNMDIVDLFIGSEGTLAAITMAEIIVIPEPDYIWGLTAFIADENKALELVEALRELCNPAAIEYFDCNAIDLLREQKKNNPAFAALPQLTENNVNAVYTELHGNDEDILMNDIDVISTLIEKSGTDMDKVWMATDDRQMRSLKFFRHAVPESVNLYLDMIRKKEPALTKLGTDLAVPDASLKETFAMYRRDLKKANLKHVIFGHIGNNHLHVNIIPSSLAEYEKGKEIYLRWANAVIKMGGTVSAEHGVGKLKTGMLEIMYGQKGVSEMRELKKFFDPSFILNRGNMFEPVSI